MIEVGLALLYRATPRLSPGLSFLLQVRQPALNGPPISCANGLRSGQKIMRSTTLWFNSTPFGEGGYDGELMGPAELSTDCQALVQEAPLGFLRVAMRASLDKQE